MGYPSILVHLDSSGQTASRVAAAAALARQHDAHLIGLAPVGWALAPSEPTAALSFEACREAAMAELRDQARSCIRSFEQQVTQMGITRFESRIAEGYAEGAVALAARYCDLTVVSQVDPAGSTAAAVLLPQDVLLRSGRPLIVLPHRGEWSLVPAPRVLVGWNASREAARAMHDALPLLKAATHVEIVVFEEPEDVDRDHGEVPGADIGLWLARHGVAVDVRHIPAKIAAGEALLAHAAETGAKLIVAGGYGHSRLREAVMGGVTHTLLRSSPVPVLLSH